jgi:hypothetical protein
MPFDGTNLPDLDAIDTAALTKSPAARWRLWLRSLWARKPGIIVPQPDRAAAVVRLLEDAKTLISDEDTWGQGAYWRFPNRRCAMGALRFAARQVDDISIARSACTVLALVATSRGFTSVECMNDRSSHAEVLRAFNEAIALTETGYPRVAELLEI